MTTYVTNQQFADTVDLHFTMASRLFKGQRRPSLLTIGRISTAYNLPITDLHEAYRKGRKPDGTYHFADYLIAHLKVKETNADVEHADAEQPA